jgi:peptidoglycan hydrolase-like protein with peptidoglycan-binding domain
MYYPYSPAYTSAAAAPCPSINRDLSIGMRGSDVSALQSYIVSRNYAGSGNWMVTGYFGRATQAGVQIFQQERGLPQTGIADAATRAALCGVNVNLLPQVPTYPTYPTYPTTPTYPTYPNYASVSISSLSMNSAAQGSQVTIYGTGFDYANNTVYIGSNPITNIASPNATSLSFVVPSYVMGTVQVSVANTRGQSNAVSLSVTPYTNPCMAYAYGSNCGGCSLYPYSYCSNGMPTIEYLLPASGAVGGTVAVYGSGFTPTGNTVRFGAGIITGLNSSDGRSLSFVVPTQLTGYATEQVAIGTYSVSVSNSAGLTSNAMAYNVTSLSSSQYPRITSATGPTSIAVSGSGTWTVVVNNPTNVYQTVSVNWGDYQSTPSQTVSSGVSTLTFSHTYAQPGQYSIVFSITNAVGPNATASATVSVYGNGGNVAISSIAPSSGRAGTQIAIYGSGFSATENTVLFGVGGTQHLPSVNGSVIYYTIPQYLSPCDVVASGTVCAQYFQQVVPGAYQVSVRNASGATGQISFTVTQ